jgi:hypothetical protein
MTIVWVRDAQRPPKHRTTTVMIAEREVLGSSATAAGAAEGGSELITVLRVQEVPIRFSASLRERWDFEVNGVDVPMSTPLTR